MFSIIIAVTIKLAVIKNYYHNEKCTEIVAAKKFASGEKCFMHSIAKGLLDHIFLAMQIKYLLCYSKDQNTA